MEDIFYLIIKVLKAIFRFVIEIIFQGIFEWFMDKCYRNYPKTMIFLSVICLMLLIGVLIYIS